MKSVRYKTANSLADLIVGIGAFVVIVPVIVMAININQGNFNFGSLTFPAISLGIGIIVITFGQSIKAVLDTANNSFESTAYIKQILLEMQAKKDL